VQAGDARGGCRLTGGIGAHRHAAVHAGEASGQQRRVGVESVTGMLEMPEWGQQKRDRSMLGMVRRWGCTLGARTF
jgi:hypothetical protein